MANPEFTVNLSDAGFDDFIRSLKEKQLIIGNKIPMNAVANTAAIGRRASERSVIASSFRMGIPQQRGSGRRESSGTFSKWSGEVGGWVSSTSRNRLGEPRRMGNFSFESLKRRTRTGGVRVAEMAHARYTHLLANLFERPALFSRNSPVVGPLWGKKARYMAGDTRRAIPVLSSITSVMRVSMPEAIRRTEQKYMKELGK